jgi:hypothetical protein
MLRIDRRRRMSRADDNRVEFRFLSIGRRESPQQEQALLAAARLRRRSSPEKIRSFLAGSSFGKPLLDFFQRLALCLGKEKRGGEEVNHCESCEKKKHCGIPVLARHWQEDHGEGGGNQLIDDQRNAHSV